MEPACPVLEWMSVVLQRLPQRQSLSLQDQKDFERKLKPSQVLWDLAFENLELLESGIFISKLCKVPSMGDALFRFCQQTCHLSGDMSHQSEYASLALCLQGTYSLMGRPIVSWVCCCCDFSSASPTVVWPTTKRMTCFDAFRFMEWLRPLSNRAFSLHRNF